ncbi:MAG TPA: RDD family protein [Bryobacteraceae bacterium]|nr:RDD family protein [Bryobacteraceae bacterium]
MRWYYAEAGQRKGPVDETSLDELVRQGVVRDDTLVWSEGMAGWQPHGSVRGARAPSTPPRAGGGETRYCSECGRPFPSHELSSVGAFSVCSACRPTVLSRMQAGAPVHPAVDPAAAVAFHYAGFWIRFLARILDGIIVGFIGFFVRLPFRIALGVGAGTIDLTTPRDPSAWFALLPAMVGLAGFSFLIGIAIQLAYEVFFLSTRGATPGKMVLGLKVIRAGGGPISPSLAAGRYFAVWLSWLTLCIGFIIAGFDREKRALHDHICQTRVIHAQ